MTQKVLYGALALVVLALGWLTLTEEEVPSDEEAAKTSEQAPEAPSAPTPGRAGEPANGAGASGRPSQDELSPALMASIVEPPAELKGSDPKVAAAVKDMAPPLGDWLVSDERIRKFVLSVNLMADGEIPEPKYRPLKNRLPPMEPEEKSERYVWPAGDAGRAQSLVEAVTAIEPQRLAAYYQLWRPRLEEAYGELGRRGSFDARLRRALQRIEQAEPFPAERQLALKQPHVLYQYQDPELEDADPLQKWLWRLGPEPMAELQDYVGRLKTEL